MGFRDLSLGDGQKIVEYRVGMVIVITFEIPFPIWFLKLRLIKSLKLG